MALEVTFDTELWLWDGDGGWHFVTLPPDVADEIDDHVPVKNGFGSVKVTATIGETTWSTSVFPHKAAQSFILPVKQQVRRANGVEAGDTVRVRLRVAR